ncbi:hypothetical protein EW145_g66 [Phellinidium pouzarii]|uniref:DNA replication checkpoint mediator MRC1 domain-containing protein n=1 Tax=Phellinidium pouzarii TaxID=167371 RepID=A0A4S4LQK9_9AGAM|nr:hypothetical protein EW145_g66 [Phellinidium pouzarii]
MDEPVSASLRVEDASHKPSTKVKRTYGRKRETALNVVFDTSATSAVQLRTDSAGESNLLEDLQLSRTLHEDVIDVFGWKKRLAEIDERFDNDDAKASSEPRVAHTSGHGLRDSSSVKSISTEGDSFSAHDDSFLSGSIPPLTSSQSDLPSPILAGPKNSKVKVDIIESDVSDGEDLAQAKESSPMSPQLNCLANTPKTRSPTTLSSSNRENDRHPAFEVSSKNRRLNPEERSGPEDVERHTKSRKSGGGKPREKINKIKKLSKKEEKELKKAHARIMADQKISVTKRAEQFTINDLLGKLQHSQRPSTGSKLYPTSSDPIQDFTSSPALISTADPHVAAGPSNLHDSSGEEMPYMRDILKKQEADAQQVVEGSIHVETHHKRSRTAADYEKKLASVAGFRMGAGRYSLPGGFEGSQGEKALKFAAKSAFGDRFARRGNSSVDHRSLQSAMLSKASKQSMQITRGKEEEWQRRGGKLSSKQRTMSVDGPYSIQRLAGELAFRKSEAESDDQQDANTNVGSGSEESNDEDWQSEVHDSVDLNAGRSPNESEEEFEGDDVGDENIYGENVNALQTAFDSEDEGKPGRRQFKVRHKSKRVIVSDSDGEEINQRQSSRRILASDTLVFIGDLGHRDPVSSASESVLDEENKENDTRLLLDNSEDKENHVTPLHSSAGRASRRSSAVLDFQERTRHLPMSPNADTGNIDVLREHKPLQARKMDDLDDLFAPSASPTISFPKPSQARFTSTSPKALRSAFGTERSFSQLFDDDENAALADENMSPKSFLQPAFRFHTSQKGSDFALRPSFEPKPLKLGNLSDVFSSDSQPRFMNRMQHTENDEFSLTLDTKLQPALEVTTQVRRKADAIFEKEQEFLLGDAKSARSHSEQELYITESGLLTQTKPESFTPIVYRSWASSQKSPVPASQATAPPMTSQRLPLSTLSFTSETSSPSEHRLSRLVKGKGRARSPVDGGDLLASGPAPGGPLNAFTELLKASKKDKKKLGKSEYVEGEAQESDEDEMFGFGVTKKDDEGESDDDDPDAIVENLVDDAAMDAGQLAEEKVLEKVKEQTEQDDAALQKYHQAAIEGKYRGKRRGGGIAMDDSDSDEEDEETRRLRQRMHKKRRIEGDSLEALGKDEKSRAFYEAYQRDVQDEDNDDFAHLTRDDMDLEDEGDENEPPEVVSTSEIQTRLREAARNRGKEMTYNFDPENVDWADTAALSDDEFDVKEVDDRPKKSISRRPIFGQVDLTDFDDSFPRHSNTWSDTQLTAWRKEQGGRNLGTGGTRGAITVTGHGSKGPGRTDRNGMSMSKNSHYAAEEEQPERRRVVKTASVLARVSSKQSRFGP